MILITSLSFLLFFYFGKKHYKQISDRGILLERQYALHHLWKTPLLCSLLIIGGISLRLLGENNLFANTLPLQLQLHSLNIFVCGLIGLVAYSSALLIKITQHEQKDQLTSLIAISFITFSLIYIYTTFSSPVYKKLKIRTKDGITLQSAAMSCAAASFANIARLHDLIVTEQEVAKEFGTTVLGTTPAQIALGAQKFNFSANIFYKQNLSQVKLPAIIYIDSRFGKEAHAVVLVKAHSTGIEIWDPDKGRLTWSQDTLHKKWHGNGISFTKN